MTVLARREVLFGSMLTGLAALGVAARPPRPDRPIVTQQQLEAGLPDRIGRFTRIAPNAIVLPPQDALSQSIYDGYVTRGYAAPGLAPIHLLVAYGAIQDYALQLHRPEICYPASGYTIGGHHARPLRLAGRTVPASTMLARLGERQDRVSWWTRIGAEFPVTAWDERRQILAAAVRREVPDGVLVRLSTTADPAAEQHLERFADGVVSLTDPAITAILLGAGQT